MKVIITPFAQQQINKTARYIQREFGKNYRRNFIQSVRETKRLLSANSYLGPIEPYLSGQPKTYRSVVVARLNKIIYRIENERIDVVDFWDCRREPEKQAAQTIARDDDIESQ